MSVEDEDAMDLNIIENIQQSEVPSAVSAGNFAQIPNNDEDIENVKGE